MKERGRRIGAEVRIRSAFDGGTRVGIVVPASAALEELAA
jgi:nitrate/nitrite-specific signal transduction histidine kinase